MRMWVHGPLLLAALVAGCGQEAVPARALSVAGSLTGSPEQLELESQASRTELFRLALHDSNAQAGQKAAPGVLFVLSHGDELLAAPGLDADLLQSWDGGSASALSLTESADPWPEEPRESLQGLSEREAAALVGASLLQRWAIVAPGQVRVDRVLGAPYAAAYVDGVLRMNPSFLYLAAAAGAPAP